MSHLLQSWQVLQVIHYREPSGKTEWKILNNYFLPPPLTIPLHWRSINPLRFIFYHTRSTDFEEKIEGLWTGYSVCRSDTSITWAPTVGPCLCLLLLVDSLYDRHIMPVQKVSDFIIERVDCIYRFPQKLTKSFHYYILRSIHKLQVTILSSKWNSG